MNLSKSMIEVAQIFAEMEPQEAQDFFVTFTLIYSEYLKFGGEELK